MCMSPRQRMPDRPTDNTFIINAQAAHIPLEVLHRLPQWPPAAWIRCRTKAP